MFCMYDAVIESLVIVEFERKLELELFAHASL